MDIKFNIDLMESLNKLSDSDSINQLEDYESLWVKFLKHIDVEPVPGDKLYNLGSDKFYNESEYQKALNFRDLFIKKCSPIYFDFKIQGNNMTEQNETTLIQDLEDLISQFSMGQISTDQVIKTLENIVKYEQNHK
tara:strand:- start:424 stop:831 length:408 start_codon:yes stop_codon:yes gene_type:complete